MCVLAEFLNAHALRGAFRLNNTMEHEGSVLILGCLECYVPRTRSPTTQSRSDGRRPDSGK